MKQESSNQVNIINQGNFIKNKVGLGKINLGASPKR